MKYVMPDGAIIPVDYYWLPRGWFIKRIPTGPWGRPEWRAVRIGGYWYGLLNAKHGF